MVNVIWTGKFEREVKKIKDGLIKERVMKLIEKIVEHPEIGKPLRYDLKGERSLYLKPFRLVYAFKDNTIFLLRFEHRGHVY